VSQLQVFAPVGGCFGDGETDILNSRLDLKCVDHPFPADYALGGHAVSSDANRHQQHKDDREEHEGAFQRQIRTSWEGPIHALRSRNPTGEASWMCTFYNIFSGQIRVRSGTLFARKASLSGNQLCI